MNTLIEKPEFQVIALLVGAAIFILVIVAVTMARFYRRCGADEAVVRTGAGGNKVVIGGGITVYPILHQLLRVSLRSIKLSVERDGKNALVTKDKIKANVTTELYVKVEPVAEDVLAAARSFGERNLDEHAIGELIEGKLTDALRSVAANQTFMDLHSKRKEFAEHIQAALSEELKKNGLTLENVSITALAMVPVKELDPQDVFDAEGLRAITESVQMNNKNTNQIQRETENAIKTQNVDARTKALALEQAQAQAEADQQRRVKEYAATQSAEMAKAVYAQQQVQELARIQQVQAIAIAEAARARAEREAQIATEKAQEAARIQKEREIEAATIEKQKVVEAAEIQKAQAIETSRIAKQIAVTQSEEQAARAAALKASAEAEQQRAIQEILTVEETAKANREKAIAIIKAEEDAQEARIAAEQEAFKTKLDAEARAAATREQADGEAAAMIALAEAILKKGQAEAEAHKQRVEAENQVSTKFLLRDVAVKALDVLPDVTRELMTPAKAISEIKVLQLQGMGASANGNGENGAQPGAFGGVASPVLKTILEAGAAYPLFRELMQFSQADTDKLADKAKALLAHLPEELKQVVEDDPELAKKIAALGARIAPPQSAQNGAALATVSPAGGE